VLEAGPRGVRPQAAGKETLWLAEQLGLADEVIGADPAAKFRYLFLDGQVRPAAPRPPNTKSSCTRALMIPKETIGCR
jgi:hypothetical protein